MKFGKVEDISSVDFSLPNDPEINQSILNSAPITDGNFYIGATSWAMKEWKSRYYPSDTKIKDFISAYGKQFNSIELNTTHYGTPKQETLGKWYDAMPADFRFCPKIHKAISHRKTLGLDSDIIENTINALSIFKEKLGPFFIQLPPYFDTSRKDLLMDFLKVLPYDLRLAVELRHPSWYEDDVFLDDFQHELHALNKSFLITDVSGRRDILHGRISADYLMVRFVGNGLHPTDYSRIDDWVSRIKLYAEHGVKEVYFFPHEPENLLAPDLGEYLCDAIIQNTTFAVRGPRKINGTQQLKMF